MTTDRAQRRAQQRKGASWIRHGCCGSLDAFRGQNSKRDHRNEFSIAQLQRDGVVWCGARQRSDKKKERERQHTICRHTTSKKNAKQGSCTQERTRQRQQAPEKTRPPSTTHARPHENNKRAESIGVWGNPRTQAHSAFVCLSLQLRQALPLLVPASREPLIYEARARTPFPLT